MGVTIVASGSERVKRLIYDFNVLQRLCNALTAGLLLNAGTASFSTIVSGRIYVCSRFSSS